MRSWKASLSRSLSIAGASSYITFIFITNRVGIRPQGRERTRLAWKPEEVTDDGQLRDTQVLQCWVMRDERQNTPLAIIDADIEILKERHLQPSQDVMLATAVQCKASDVKTRQAEVKQVLNFWW